MGTTTLKQRIKNGIAWVRQHTGHPHDIPPAHSAAALAAFNALDPASLDALRCNGIAEATGCDPAVIAGWLADYTPPPVSAEDAATWDTRGGPAMSARDRVTLYALLRALEPGVCVETGTAGGASAAIILAQMATQERGHLHSIDVASPHAGHYGALIPSTLRDRWTLHLEPPSRTPWPGLADSLPGWLYRCWQRHIERPCPALPALLNDLDAIDFFLHDSRHTFRHMRWEYDLAWAHLAPGGCLASHDVLASTAFDDFRRDHAPRIASSAQIGNFGFAIKS